MVGAASEQANQGGGQPPGEATAQLWGHMGPDFLQAVQSGIRGESTVVNHVTPTDVTSKISHWWGHHVHESGRSKAIFLLAAAPPLAVAVAAPMIVSVVRRLLMKSLAVHGYMMNDPHDDPPVSRAAHTRWLSLRWVSILLRAVAFGRTFGVVV